MVFLQISEAMATLRLDPVMFYELGSSVGIAEAALAALGESGGADAQL